MTLTVHERPLLRVREVAARLGVSERTIRRLIATDRLPIVKVGRQVRIDQSELELLLDGDPCGPVVVEDEGERC
jgi:excisionase family DNA binding protein